MRSSKEGLEVANAFNTSNKRELKASGWIALMASSFVAMVSTSNHANSDLGSYRDGTITGIAAPSQTLRLMDSNGKTVAESRADASGRYLFRQLNVGPFGSQTPMMYRVYDPRKRCASRPIPLTPDQSYGYINRFACQSDSQSQNTLPQYAIRSSMQSYRNKIRAFQQSKQYLGENPRTQVRRGNRPMYGVPNQAGGNARNPFPTRSPYISRRQSFSNKAATNNSNGRQSPNLSQLYSTAPWSNKKSTSQPTIITLPINIGPSIDATITSLLLNPKYPLVRNILDFQPEIDIEASPVNTALNKNTNTVSSSSSSSASNFNSSTNFNGFR